MGQTLIQTVGLKGTVEKLLITRGKNFMTKLTTEVFARKGLDGCGKLFKKWLALECF